MSRRGEKKALTSARDPAPWVGSTPSDDLTNDPTNDLLADGVRPTIPGNDLR